MRPSITMILGLGLLLVGRVTVGRGEWKIRVHQGESVAEFTASAVDSVTFYNSLVPPLVAVPAGVFTMGDGSAYCGEQQHQVTLTRAFYLGQHEVTNQEYLDALQWAYDHGYVSPTSSVVMDNLNGYPSANMIDLTGQTAEIAFSGGVFTLRDAGHGINPDHPVKEVTFWGSVRYCDWLSMQAGLPRAYQGGNWACNYGDPYGAQGYRLPTDAEWEYAAQWNDERIYPWGNEAFDCSQANGFVYAPCVGWTTPVGSYPAAPAALGLSDMAGNVWERVNDYRLCGLGTTPVIDPVGPASGDYHVIRGGAWWDTGPLWMRCANRYLGGWGAGYGVGFRIARTIAP